MLTDFEKLHPPQKKYPSTITKTSNWSWTIIAVFYSKLALINVKQG